MAPAKLSDLGTVFTNLVGWVLGFVGIVLFIVLLIGGFKYITSGGDPKAIESAKGTITAGIAGLIIILVSYLIMILISNITGVNVTQFNLTI
jgi:hypothetical protein